jgi:hypothetical protein
MTWIDLESLLKLTDEGREALQTMQSYGVMVSWAPSGPPALYEANSNSCRLDSSLKAPTQASYFVHEMVHALNEKALGGSDINTLSQDDYVKEMVSEEYVATTRQYQFFVTLDVNGHLPPRMPVRDMPPRYLEYRSAYNTGITRAGGSTSDKSELHLMGMVNANRLLKIYIYDRGLGVGFMNYTEFYGRQWQQNKFQHP